MCFYSRQSKSAIELQNRFNATFENGNQYSPSDYNGFQFPETPIIANTDSSKIQLYHWGLIPNRAKDNSIRKYTLNARIETIKEKPSFRDSVTRRCLVLVDGFYEWREKITGDTVKTYTILTTEANELMSIIHNKEKRMPVILTKNNELDWLNGKEINNIEIELKATAI
jgi:putative SOS response-associated peptidase YedK